jgi:hypothetical protein
MERTRGTMRLLALLLVAICFGACQPFPSASHTSAPTPTPTAPTITWDELVQRPLHIPAISAGATCPRDHGHFIDAAFAPGVGSGPVYAVGFLGQTDGILPYAPPQNYHSATWGGEKTLWAIAPSYRGAVIVRGRQLDGPHEIRFDNGLDEHGVYWEATLQPFLRLMGGEKYATPGGNPWANYATNTRLEAPGCYAFQVDGASFSYLIVFEATDQLEDGA